MFMGFDMVIGNPPYIKEYEGKEIFDGLRSMETYQGKMDMWYLFGELGSKLLKKDALMTFIAPNNWITNSGASRFRNYLLLNMKLVKLIDFGSYFIFDSASIQTMVFELKKNISNEYNFDYRKINTSRPTIIDIHDLLNNLENKSNIHLNPTVSIPVLLNKTLTFSSNSIENLLRKVEEKGAFKLNEDEVAQGIVPNPDIINSRNISLIGKLRIENYDIKVGDGVFVIRKGYFNMAPECNKKYIKPLYEPYQLSKYSELIYDKEIIYITKQNYKNDAPLLINHLEKYREIMDRRRENLNNKLDFYHSSLASQ